MEEEKIIENELVDSVTQQPSTNSNDIYNNINKLNSKLDELNEVYNPTVSPEINNDVAFALNNTEESVAITEEPVVNNEIAMPTVSEEEASKDLNDKKEGKGQYILITILTIILISLLLLIIYFTSSL